MRTTRNLTTAWEEGARAGRHWGSTGGGGGPDPSSDPPVHEPWASAGPLPHTEAVVHTVKFRLNALIEPDHLDGPPGYDLAYDYEYFSGDGRGSSSDISVTARLHSEVEIGGVDTGSPDIDVNGTFSVNAATGDVEFSGSIDAFPWHEAYASVNGGAPVTLMAENPTGTGATDLMGGATRGVHGTGNGL